MATSTADIANFALSHLAVSVDISNLETDRSKEALACRRFYEQARDEALRDGVWPFATVIEQLALVEEAPNDEWLFSYRWPSNCLAIMSLRRPGVRNPGQGQAVPHRVIRDDAGLLILTDLPDAIAEYTIREEDVTRYPPDFVQAVACLLASYIAPRLTAGDAQRLGERALQLYQWRLGAAAAAAARDEQPDMAPESEFIRARF